MNIHVLYLFLLKIYGSKNKRVESYTAKYVHKLIASDSSMITSDKQSFLQDPQTQMPQISEQLLLYRL